MGGYEDKSSPIRVVLVDNSGRMRRVARLCLHMEPGFTVVGEATNGAQAVAVADETQPDIVLLDLDMPAMNGLSSIPAIRTTSPGSRIAVLSSYPDPFTLGDALTWGADTYLDQTTTLIELTTILRALVSASAA
ncbi:MAG: response regulator transcription factor [Acidimicrobiales bacterium]